MLELSSLPSEDEEEELVSLPELDVTEIFRFLSRLGTRLGVVLDVVVAAVAGVSGAVVAVLCGTVGIALMFSSLERLLLLLFVLLGVAGDNMGGLAATESVGNSPIDTGGTKTAEGDAGGGAAGVFTEGEMLASLVGVVSFVFDGVERADEESCFSLPASVESRTDIRRVGMDLVWRFSGVFNLESFSLLLKRSLSSIAAVDVVADTSALVTKGFMLFLSCSAAFFAACRCGT